MLQGLHDEIAGLLELAKTGAARRIEAITAGKPYEGLFTASQDYFTVYHANAELVMQIDDACLRRKIILTYIDIHFHKYPAISPTTSTGYDYC